MGVVTIAFLLLCAGTLLLYFLAPKKIRWTVLLVASYVFYWFSSHRLMIVLITMTLITFAVGLLIDRIRQRLRKNAGDTLTPAEKKTLRAEEKKQTKRILVLGIIADIGILLLMKYTNFFLGTANNFFGANFRFATWAVPIGISFYTLQAVSYMVDVYRGKCEADRNIFKFMLYMAYFPQIIQGPIPRYNQLANQLYEGHSLDTRRLARGAMLMLWGYMKKTLIADRAAIPVNMIFGNSTAYSGGIVLFAAVLYSVQIYADFSGGMDIVTGFSEMLGISLTPNFRQPYFSQSVEEFWRRWHITLGNWMRDYVFYPLSLCKPFTRMSKWGRKHFGDFVGKRIGPFVAMFIVYVLVGFWHGPSLHYIAYGIWNGLFIMTGILMEDCYRRMRERLGLRDEMVGWRIFRMIRTFFVISVGRFFARGEGFRLALGMIRSAFTHPLDVSYLVDGSLLKLGLDQPNWTLLLICAIVLLVVDYIHEKDISCRDVLLEQNIMIRWAVVFAALFLVLIFGIYGPGYNASAFIYEQF